jgi:hypothetical protein
MPKINKPKKQNQSKISSQATEKTINYNDQHGKFAFSSVCNRHCQLSEWQRNELDELIGYFKKVEQSIWKNILKDDGFNYESHNLIDLPVPETLPPDASLDSMRVTQKMRIYGYRTQDIFNIIWFDREHKVCPEGKKWRYKIS